MRTRNQVWRLVLPLSLSLVLLAGCSMSFGKSKDAAAENETSKIKVMYYDENSFFSQYGMLFSALYPNIEVEVVSSQVPYEQGKDMNEEFQKLVDEKKPDVLMLSTDQYKKFASVGKLADLDTMVQEDDFDLEGIMPGLIDYIKTQSDGKLYGLAPSFYNNAVYYNKDLFEKYGIPLPHDKMSWDELLQLAARFPATGGKNDRVYGLKMNYQNDLFSIGTTIGASQGLSIMNPNSMQVTMDTDSWKAVFETALKAYKSGSLYTQEPNNMASGTSYEDYLIQDPFVGRKVAMTIDGTYLMNQIKQAQQQIKDKAIQNWDMVTVPVDPQQPDSSTSMSVSQIFAIDAKSPNSKAAWEFIKYIHSDDFARVTSKTNNGNFPIRTKYIKDDEGHHMEAFYSLKPAESPMYKGYDKFPQEFLMQFQGMAQQELKAVTDNKSSVSEALASLQAKAQAALTQANEKAAAGGKKQEQSGGSGGTAATDSKTTSSATSTATVTAE